MSLQSRGKNFLFCDSLAQRSRAFATNVFCTSTTTDTDGSKRDRA